MPRMAQYVAFAEEAYLRANDSVAPRVGEHSASSLTSAYTVQKREWATSYGNGFQGAVYDGPDDVVVAFSGTMGGPLSAPVGQNTANLRIAARIVPNMAGNAYRMASWALRFSNGRPVSVVGHSLGGGLAQIVGNWCGCPFVSLNGPGMQQHLAVSGFNLLAPMQMARTLRSAAKEAPQGVCFRVDGDFVAHFGVPLGRVEDLPVPTIAGNDTHSLTAVTRGLYQRSMLNHVPF